DPGGMADKLARFGHSEELAEMELPVVLWEPRTGRVIGRFHGRAPLLFSPDGARLATGSRPGIRLWRVGEGEGEQRAGPSGSPIAFFTGDEMLIRAGEGVKRWSLSTGSVVDAIPEGAELLAICPTRGLAVLRGGAAVADGAGGADGITIWDMRIMDRVAT